MNIVFDLGGVIFRWQPDTIIRHTVRDPEARGLVRTEIFEHADWIELDKGAISVEQAIARGASRTGLPRENIELIFNEVPRFLTPMQETIDLIHSLRKTNCRLFVLSNMHLASITYLEQKHKIWDLFDGTVISCRIQMVKPEIEIFRHLLATWELEATETVFVDDTDENLEAAASIGIHSMKFVNASQCRRHLSRFLNF